MTGGYEGDARCFTLERTLSYLSVMRELPQKIPDVSMLLSLEPEELAGKMLFLMRKRLDCLDPMATTSNRAFALTSFINELWGTVATDSGNPQYPREKAEEITLAISEAWAWLAAQGLLVPATGAMGEVGRRLLSRRARKMETDKDFADYRIARLLPKEILHRRIADVVWGDFVRGEYDSSAFQAMKAVEVSVREAANLEKGKIGIELMQEAFAPEKGR